MKTHTVSIGYHAVYNINVGATSAEKAEEIVRKIHREQGLAALIAMGRFMPPCGEEDVHIQYEGEAE
ncbi:MAG: hypothetical protein AAGB32_03750 [Pseudomonadota bacterium]